MKHIPNRKTILIPGLSAALALSLLAGCGSATANAPADRFDGAAATDTAAVVTTAAMIDAAVPVSAAVDESGATAITLSGATASVSGSGATVDGGVVTITAGGAYVLSGTLTEGRVIVDAKGEDVVLVLDGASITCSYGSPIYIYKAASATIHLEDGTENVLTDGAAYTFADGDSSAEDDEPNACLYSKADLVIQGTGSLTVYANYKNGITSKDTLTITGADVTVYAKNNGITGKDSADIANATITVACGGDAIRSTNDTDETLGWVRLTDSELSLSTDEDGVKAKTSLTVNGGTYRITAGDDAIHADGTVQIDGGSFTIDAAEGIEGTVVRINDGVISIQASDDGINAARQSGLSTPLIEINGGEITIVMGSGDTDGVDSNGDIIINGGTIDVTGNSTFDYDGTAQYNGGTIIVNGQQVDSIPNQMMGGMGGFPSGGPGGWGGQPDGGRGGQGGFPSGGRPGGGRGAAV